MSNSDTVSPGIQAARESIDQAVNEKWLTASARDNIWTWLTDNRYRDYREQVLEHIQNQQWKVLDNVFWTVIPFGTGGRRGRMYPIGCNAINDRTIGESAQGLADYVRSIKPSGPFSAAIAYDTRHRSREFAELCAEILVAAGFTVYFIDDYRSTPELSFLIRHRQCDCGIMVTASHNPPSDNAVKVYWSSGVQLIPPHDKRVIAKVAEVVEIHRSNFAQAVAAGQVVFCREETDRALLAEHKQQSFGGPRDLKIIYSPLHGVGEFNVSTLLEAVGFSDVEIFGPHREPNGDFPNVPGHVSNPENAAVFDDIIRRAQEVGAELILATDPDCDRMGAAAPTTMDPRGPWQTLNGNQLSALLCEFVLARRQQLGRQGRHDYIVTTLVTTGMLRRISQAFDVNCFDNNLVGFKWICSVMDEEGPSGFAYGTEESHGFLVGSYCRDKDGAVACMLMSELAAWVKAQGISLFEHLDQLYLKYGYHAERLLTIQMEGSDGMHRMTRLMEQFRNAPPRQLGTLNVVATRDHLNLMRATMSGNYEGMDGPKDNLIFLETEVSGNYVAVRPSGTEPKVKFYMFTFVPPSAIRNLSETKAEMSQRLDEYNGALQAFSATVK